MNPDGDLYFKGNRNKEAGYKVDNPERHKNRNPGGGAVTHGSMSWMYTVTILTVGLWWGG